MATFWLGAGAAATAILAVIGILQYLRSRSNLLVDVTQYRFELPVTARRALVELSELISPLEIDKPPVQIDDDLAGKVQAMINLFGARFARASDIEVFWHLTLTNRGHERAEGVELHVPWAVQIEVRRGGASQVVENDRVVIGDVRPGARLHVVAWGRRPFDEPSVIQSKGRAVVRRPETVGPPWVFVSEVWKFGKVPLTLLLLGLAYVVIRIVWPH